MIDKLNYKDFITKWNNTNKIQQSQSFRYITLTRITKSWIGFWYGMEF